MYCCIFASILISANAIPFIPRGVPVIFSISPPYSNPTYAWQNSVGDTPIVIKRSESNWEPKRADSYLDPLAGNVMGKRSSIAREATLGFDILGGETIGKRFVWLPFYKGSQNKDHPGQKIGFWPDFEYFNVH